jgi:dolichyl-phosphate-mannose--protein O-mannosyl transferase
LPPTILVGPVFSSIAGTVALFFMHNINMAVIAILGIGLVCGSITLSRGREWTIYPDIRKWLPVVIFSCLVGVFINTMTYN